MIGGIGLFLAGMRFRVWWRISAGILFAVLAACGSVLVLDAIFGALTGASAALIGIGLLGSFTFVTFVAACQAVVGLPGTGLAAVYLPDAGLGHPLLVLGIWLAGSLAVLCLVDLLHLAERRHLPEREAEIFATPGTVHIKQRIARRQTAALSGGPSPATGRLARLRPR